MHISGGLGIFCIACESCVLRKGDITRQRTNDTNHVIDCVWFDQQSLKPQ